MKKRILALSIILMLIFCTGCSNEGQVKRDKIATTDLSAVNVNEIVLGISVESLDLTKYTVVPKEQTADETNTKYFEEMSITTDNSGIITSVKGNIGTGTKVSVNNSQPSSVNEIIEGLGTNYNEYWFDREQNLKAHTYYDETNKTYATFVSFDSNLVWLILSE